MELIDERLIFIALFVAWWIGAALLAMAIQKLQRKS
jgi:hypothetical protein